MGKRDLFYTCFSIKNTVKNRPVQSTRHWSALCKCQRNVVFLKKGEKGRKGDNPHTISFTCVSSKGAEKYPTKFDSFVWRWKHRSFETLNHIQLPFTYALFTVSVFGFDRFRRTWRLHAQPTIHGIHEYVYVYVVVAVSNSALWSGHTSHSLSNINVLSHTSIIWKVIITIDE